MTFFDRSFVLTIARLRERASLTFDHLRQAGVEATAFTGFDASNGLKTELSYELDHPGTGYRIGPKTVAIYLGHVALWRAIAVLPVANALILEDDVRLTPDWRERFDSAIPSLPPDWDMVYLGSCCCLEHDGVERVSGHLHRIRYGLCTHAYAIAQKAIPVMIQECERVDAPVDIAVCVRAMPRLNVYAFLPRLAFQNETVIPP